MMNTDDKMQQSKGYQNFRVGLDIGMGTLYLVLGISIVYLRYFGNIELNETYAMVLGCLMIGYGIFRLYRGLRVVLRKNRQANRQF